MRKKSLLKYIYYPFLHTRAETLAKLIQHYISPKSSVLDIGCGNLLISKKLKSKIKIQVTGIDVLDMNLTDLPHQIFDGKKIPFSDNNFDVSFLIGVLHHVENQQILLEETRRVTRKKIIIFEDVYFFYIEKLWLKIRDIIGNIPEEMRMNFALSFHNTDEWEKLFNKHNLKIVHEKVFLNFLRLTHHAFYVLEKAEKNNVNYRNQY